MLRVRSCTSEQIVHLKRQRIRAKVSYMFVRKRLERLGLIPWDQYATVQFRKLEESLYGVPYWKARVARRRAVG